MSLVFPRLPASYRDQVSVMDENLFPSSNPLKPLRRHGPDSDVQYTLWSESYVADQFFDVIDVSLLPNTPPEQHASWCGHTPIATALDDLPPQSPSSCRMYFISNMGDSTEFASHLDSLIGRSMPTFVTEVPVRSSLRYIKNPDALLW
jgi:hypothetical protein